MALKQQNDYESREISSKLFLDEGKPEETSKKVEIRKNKVKQVKSTLQ